MPVLYHDIEVTIITAGGTGTGVSPIPTRGSALLFYVHPATETTKWDLKIIDQRGRIVRHYREQIGTLADQDANELPMQGSYTFTFENTTANEQFDILVRVQQHH